MCFGCVDVCVCLCVSRCVRCMCVGVCLSGCEVRAIRFYTILSDICTLNQTKFWKIALGWLCQYVCFGCVDVCICVCIPGCVKVCKMYVGVGVSFCVCSGV